MISSKMLVPIYVILCTIALTTVILYSGLWQSAYTFGDVQTYSANKYSQVAQYAEQVKQSINSMTLVPQVKDAEIEPKNEIIEPTDPPYTGPMVSIVVVSDNNFLKKYEYQMNTQKCFAKKHGYEHTVVNPNDYIECKKYQDFFFRKHCAVRVWLHSKPEGFTAVIVDGDVIAGVSEFGLQQWLDIDFDVLLYERDWNYEITAGIYMVRNTNYGKSFLKAWADFEWERPKGFSSSDNGAIHGVLIQELGLKDAQHCLNLYHELVDSIFLKK